MLKCVHLRICNCACVRCVCVCVCVCGSVYVCSNYEASSMIMEISLMAFPIQTKKTTQICIWLISSCFLFMFRVTLLLEQLTEFKPYSFPFLPSLTTRVISIQFKDTHSSMRRSTETNKDHTSISKVPKLLNYLPN